MRGKLRAASLAIEDVFGNGSDAQTAFQAAQRLRLDRVLDYLDRAAKAVEMAAEFLPTPADARDARARSEALREDQTRLMGATRKPRGAGETER